MAINTRSWAVNVADAEYRANPVMATTHIVAAHVLQAAGP